MCLRSPIRRNSPAYAETHTAHQASDALEAERAAELDPERCFGRLPARRMDTMAQRSGRRFLSRSQRHGSPMIDSDAIYVATPQTSWTMVELAQDGNQDAIELFVNRYATPIYCFLRQRGSCHDDAKDLVQEVFMRLFQDGCLRRNLSRKKGKLRSYLLQTARNVHNSTIRNESAEKRPPRHLRISLEKAFGKAGPHFEPVANDSPEDVYERREARRALNDIIRQLQAGCEEDELSAHFAIFADCFLGGWSPDESRPPFKDTGSLKDAEPLGALDSDRWAGIANRNEVSVQRAQNMCKTVNKRMTRLLQQEYTAKEISQLIAVFARAMRSERLGY